MNEQMDTLVFIILDRCTSLIILASAFLLKAFQKLTFIMIIDRADLRFAKVNLFNCILLLKFNIAFLLLQHV